MKRKRFALAAALTILAFVLGGCSLFTTGGDNAPQPGGSAGPIQMTDKYTFTDPDGLTFATRYALYCDANSKIVATAAGYGVQAMYAVLYADENDAPVRYAEFMVCDTPEHAQAVIELYASMGSTLSVAEEDPCVVYSSTDADTMEAMLLTYQSSGIIPKATVSAYLAYYKTYTGGTIME